MITSVLKQSRIFVGGKVGLVFPINKYWFPPGVFVKTQIILYNYFYSE